MGEGKLLNVAYLVNQYPKVSHSFIRREIVGLEASGVTVERFAIRSCAAELVDTADQQELAKTRIVLEAGAPKLLGALIRMLLTRPKQWFQALAVAVQFGRRSERGVLRHLVYLVEASLLCQWLGQTKIQHIHAHFGTNSTTVALLCHILSGVTYSFTVHGPEEFDRVYDISLADKIRRAAFVVAISSYGQSQLYRWCSHDQWPKIQVVHCGVDDSFLEQPPTAISSEPRLVCVGRLCEQKGQLLLLEAIAQLAQEGLTFKLILVGDGPLRPEIEALMARNNLQDYVEITGWASNERVRHELLRSRAMVLPSFAEGLPVVIMEALALQRPVLSTYVAGIPELVVPEQCGWLVPPGSVKDLVDALRVVLQASVEQLETLGRAGRERVAVQHNISLESSKLANLFLSVGQSELGQAAVSETLRSIDVSHSNV